MALFQHKKADGDVDGPLHFFDEYFREELRQKGREYFEKVIDDNATIFKKDLETLVVGANTEIKEHLIKHLDGTLTQVNVEITKLMEEQLDNYSKKLSESQDAALQKLEQRNKELEDQHQELNQTLQKSITDQEAVFVSTYKENAAKIAELQEAHTLALRMLSDSAQALERQHQQLEAILQKTVANQEHMLVDVFEKNMAQIIEHYLLGALGDQFDLKAQLPAIIKQMEENKQAIADDMKL